MTRYPTDLESQLRAWAEHLEHSIPAYERHGATKPVSAARRQHGPRRRAMVAAALLTSIAGGAALWGTTDDDRSRLAAGPAGESVGTIATQHERVEYEQDAQLACTASSLSVPGSYDTMVIESWGDPTTGRWRTTVTYPDGSSRDVLVVGPPTLQSPVLVRGMARGDVLGCEPSDGGLLVAEPAQSDLYFLNHPLAGQRTATGAPWVIGYDTSGTQVPGSHVDSRGRTAELWRQQVTGFIDSGTDRRPVTQVTQWFVEPGTGRVLERTYENVIESLGRATSRTTLIESGPVTVPTDFFDEAGYQRSG